MFIRHVITTDESERDDKVEGQTDQERRRGRVGGCSEPGDKGRILFAGLETSFTAAKFNSLTR